MDLALEKVGYDQLRTEQAVAREQGRLIGIGLASFTEVVGAGPHKYYDIMGLKMNDGAELRVHPTGKAILKISSKTQGQGHETTFAQIVASELGIQPEDIKVMHGDTDNTPAQPRRSVRRRRSSLGRCATRPASSRRTCSRSRRTTSSSSRAGSP